MPEDTEVNEGQTEELLHGVATAKKQAHVRRVFIRTVEQKAVLTVGALGALYSPFTSGKPAVRIEVCTDDDIKRLHDDKSVEVFEDFRLEPLAPWWLHRSSELKLMAPAVWQSKTQRDVLEHIRAPKAWETTKGKGVTIAVVDTGVDASTAFVNRSNQSFCPLPDAKPWIDPVGHGTMCASIACAPATAKYAGVAPEATLLSARAYDPIGETFMASDLYLVYRHLIDRKRNGAFPGGLVVSNSFGHDVCQPPAFDDGKTIPEAHPFVGLVRDCIQEGIVFVFAAGNAHASLQCRNPVNACGPNTIWATNSIDEVIAVGTVNWDETNQTNGVHSNSSRGPGYWSKRKDKPDVVAPTYGEVAWGSSYEAMEWWGTSGAAPQVAGLAALMLAKKPDLTPAQILQAVRASARALPKGDATCVGAGIIDCENALKML